MQAGDQARVVGFVGFGVGGVGGGAGVGGGEEGGGGVEAVDAKGGEGEGEGLGDVLFGGVSFSCIEHGSLRRRPNGMGGRL